MQYIASLSYGKDSIAMLEVIHQNKIPIDRIVHVEVMATNTIHADLPEMVEFKDKADKIIKERYGINVEHISASKSYEQCFYQKFNRGKRVGMIWGFPSINGNWCNSQLKMSPINKLLKGNVSYVGIAIDEPQRFHMLSEYRRSPLVEHEVTEQVAKDICVELDLLSPIYTQATRGGCWFCHNQRLSQLRYLRKQYPEYWQMLLKWDSDSPVSFRPDGKTIHDLDARFAEEELQVSMFG